MDLNIYSEIQPLRKILLHRPNKELENLIPKYLKTFLFDDIPYLKIAQQEHDAFSELLKKNGVKIYYLENLFNEIIKDNREAFLDEFIFENQIKGNKKKQVISYIKDIEDKYLFKNLTQGLVKDKKFLLNPLPNLYFTKDSSSVIGSTLIVSSMTKKARRIETLFLKYIFRHSEFRDLKIFYDRESKDHIEGGDILVLNSKALAIGVSQRTTYKAIKKLANEVFENESFNKILVIEIPKKRAYMHLDTVFTMVDYNKFTVFSDIEKDIKNNKMILHIFKKDESNYIIQERNNLKEALKEILQLDEIILIPCGGGDYIASQREQWNDGSNTLALSPGKVIVYNRNYITNQLLKDHGIETLEIQGSELSRGRGGPRCMSMPLVRN